MSTSCDIAAAARHPREKLIPRPRLLCSWQRPQTIVSPVASLISRPRRSQRHNNSSPLNDLRLLSPKTHSATKCPTRQDSPGHAPPARCRQNRLRPRWPTIRVGPLGRLAKTSPFSLIQAYAWARAHSRRSCGVSSSRFIDGKISCSRPVLSSRSATESITRSGLKAYFARSARDEPPLSTRIVL